MDYLKKTFSVGLTSKNYRDNWDSVFGGDGQARLEPQPTYDELVSMVVRLATAAAKLADVLPPWLPERQRGEDGKPVAYLRHVEHELENARALLAKVKRG